MSDPITQLGVGGVFAIVVVREVLNFVKNRNGKLSPGNYVTKSEFEEHKKSVRYSETCEQIVKRLDGRFDSLDRQLSDIRDRLS